MTCGLSEMLQYADVRCRGGIGYDSFGNVRFSRKMRFYILLNINILAHGGGYFSCWFFVVNTIFIYFCIPISSDFFLRNPQDSAESAPAYTLQAIDRPAPYEKKSVEQDCNRGKYGAAGPPTFPSRPPQSVFRPPPPAHGLLPHRPRRTPWKTAR